MGKWEVNLANTEKSGVYHSSECFPIIYICFIRFLITNDKCTIDLLQDYVTTEYAAEQNKLYTPNMFESGIFPPLPYLRLKLECFLFSLKCIYFISLRLLKKKWIHEKHFFLFMHHNINWYFCVHLCNRKNKKYSTLRFVHFNIYNTEVQCWIRSGFFFSKII